jgi:hypothetical protein
MSVVELALVRAQLALHAAALALLPEERFLELAHLCPSPWTGRPRS